MASNLKNMCVSPNESKLSTIRSFQYFSLTCTKLKRSVVNIKCNHPFSLRLNKIGNDPSEFAGYMISSVAYSRFPSFPIRVLFVQHLKGQY